MQISSAEVVTIAIDTDDRRKVQNEQWGYIRQIGQNDQYFSPAGWISDFFEHGQGHFDRIQIREASANAKIGYVPRGSTIEIARWRAPL